MARTPVPSGAAIGSRASGLSGAGCSGYSDRRAERSEAVERTAETVDDAAEQSIADCRGCDGAARDEPIAGADAGGLAERNRQQGAVAEADDFHRQR